MKQKRVFLLCGAPGSGKSTWIKKQIETESGIWCSRDNVRYSLLKDEDEYFAKENQVFTTWINNIQQALNNNVENVYIDATHLNEASRNKTLSHLTIPDNYNLIAVCFRPPLSTCLERNAKRQGRERVPDHVVRSMYNRYTKPSSIDFKEVWLYNG